MDKADLDKMIICRAVIDKYRAFNKARVEALVSSKSLSEAKDYIENKIGATTITAETVEKSKDSIKSLLEDERTKYTLEIYTVLRDQGFVDSDGNGSVRDFAEWYEEKILELYKESIPIHGTCDLCGEKELIDQPCVKMYKTKDVCVATAKDVTDGIYKNGLLLRRMGLTVSDTSERRGLCPKGHGFWADSSEYKKIPDGISFDWKV